MVQIRQAIQADRDAIARLWHGGWHMAHAGIVSADLVRSRSPAEFTDRVTAHLGGCYVAQIDGAMAGFFMLEGAELYQFYIAPDHHGRGVASRMMHAAEARLPKGRVTLDCSVGNDRAARFYEKCGWHRSSTRTLQVETGNGTLPVETWVFEKTL